MSFSVLRARANALPIFESVVLLAGCGGEDNGDANAAAGQRSGAPTISGAPSTQVLAGTPYSFTPSGSDPDGNALTFTATNVPAWASFNSATGRLSGTPSQAQVGTYSDIRISVSDGTIETALPAFSIQVVATATGSALLTWNPPTQNEDGSAINDLVGYRVYWGTAQDNYSNSASVGAGLSSYVVDQLTPARWYFALTAVNSAGIESAYSNVASKQVL
jgi:hypothetical protein